MLTTRVVAALVGIASAALAQQQFPRKIPTSADYAALGTLPDFYGVWETENLRGGGRGAARAGPALTPEYAAKAAELAKNARRTEGSISANCLPPGLPGSMGQPYPIEILLTPGQVTIAIEAYTRVRHIYTDGRKLPEDPELRFDGFSVGRWENGTLIVETVGFADVPRGLNFPYSEKMKIVERFKLADQDTLTVETSIQDPVALTAPFSLGSRRFKRHRSWTLAEYVCEENNRDFVDAAGKAGIKSPPPSLK